MSQPTSPFAAGLKAPNPFARPIKAAIPSLAAAPVALKLNAGGKRANPFLTAANMDSAEFRQAYGVNQPLEKPMFVGYRNEQPVFAGSRLFLLY